MMKHTPGPWIVDNNADGRKGLTVRGGITVPGASGPVSICQVNKTLRDYDEYNANAVAIAATPDLIEALLDCITTPGALAERSHEYAMRRLETISRTAREALERAGVTP